MTRTHRQTPLDSLYVHRPRLWLVVILLLYVVLAFRFAALTPAWQAPDEPAHYNYIAHIAQTGSLPILQMGDYDQATLEKLKSEKFPPELSIDGVRYENYQPPLYYLLSAIVFRLSSGSLLVLRLFNVVLGFFALLLLYRSLELVFPNKPLISLSATSFAALLPMHLAVTASLNNDVLAELLINATLLILLTWMERYYQPAAEDAGVDWRQLLLLGLFCGLGLITKIYAYVMLPIVVLTVIVVLWRRRSALGQGILSALWVAIPALLMGLPLWIRNILTYGNWDVMGLRWHDHVVIGQMTTTEFLTEFGWVAYSERALNFTFRSFWGVFGWLGVFMDERIYTAFLIFSGVLFLGLLWAVVRFISGVPDTDMNDFQIAVLVLLGVMMLAVLASYAWYNVKFVQHQGRYFFWGMLPISTAVALGWREVLQPLQGLITGTLGAVVSVAIIFRGFIGGDVDTWTVLMIGMISVLLMVQPLLRAPGALRNPHEGSRWQRLRRAPLFTALLGLMRWGVWATPFLLLLATSLLAPILFIIPQLT